MSAVEVFHDTNVLLYLMSADTAKADRAEALLARGGCISVQVLNEFASVASRKLAMPWSEIEETLAGLRRIVGVHPLTEETHDLGLALARDHQLAVYDAMIVASALIAECKILYSEDLQHGRVFEGQLRIQNPFAPRHAGPASSTRRISRP